jgi:hypothetical protein
MVSEMLEAAESLEFERAALLRDQIKELRSAAGIKGSEKGSGAGGQGGNSGVRGQGSGIQKKIPSKKPFHY